MKYRRSKFGFLVSLAFLSRSLSAVFLGLFVLIFVSLISPVRVWLVSGSGATIASATPEALTCLSGVAETEWYYPIQNIYDFSSCIRLQTTFKILTWLHMNRQSVWGIRMLSMLQFLSQCLSTLSLSSTLETNHYKKQIIYSRFLTGSVLLIFQGAVPGPAASQFQHCQSSHQPNLSSLHQADISLNINDSFYVWQ